MDKAAFLLLAVLCLGLEKAPVPSARAAWQSDWEKTVQAAKQEGKIFIYAALGPYHADIFAEFQKDYPEIKASILHGNSSRISPRLFAERRGANISRMSISEAPHPSIAFIRIVSLIL